MAARLEFTQDKLEYFRRSLREVADAQISTEMLIPKLEVEAEIPFQAVTAELLRGIERLAPFGCGNHRPVFACRDVKLLSSRVVGKDGKHLKITVGDEASNCDGIGFNFGSLYEKVSSFSRIDLVFCLQINEWNNQLQLVLKDLCPVG